MKSADSPTNLETAASIVWMIDQLKTRGSFSYPDWCERFRGDEKKCLRSDRRFLNHLRFFRQETLPVIHSRQCRLEQDDQVYRLRGQDLVDLEFRDEEWSNYTVLLHGLNRAKTLIPRPALGFENKLEEVVDTPDELKGRVLYKNTFSWNFPSEFLDTFLNAVHQKKCLRVVPQLPRKPEVLTPLFVLNCDGAWHLLGLNEHLRQYNLSLVESLAVDESAAQPVPSKDLTVIRTCCLEVFGINLFPSKSFDGVSRVVEILFRGAALKYAKERYQEGPRHPHDVWFERRETPEGLVVKLKVNNYTEIIGALLTWGADAKALAPPDFTEAWKAKIKEMAELLTEAEPPLLASSVNP